MHILNFYEGINQHKTSIAFSSKDGLKDALCSLKSIISSYSKEWHKEHEFITFRIEVIDQENQDIRNIIWESRWGYFKACSLEKYIHHLINKETYQIWIKDYVNDEGICKFAD